MNSLGRFSKTNIPFETFQVFYVFVRFFFEENMINKWMVKWKKLDCGIVVYVIKQLILKVNQNISIQNTITWKRIR